MFITTTLLGGGDIDNAIAQRRCNPHAGWLIQLLANKAESMEPTLELPDHVQAAIQQDDTGAVADYIQRVNPRWSPTDCYQSAITMIQKNKN